MNDERIIERKRLVDGRVFDVDRLSLKDDEFGVVQRDVIVHGGAVVVLPIMDDGRIVLIRNHRFALGKLMWELCAGTLEKDEVPAVCAARELREETGYEAAEITPACGFYSCPGFCTEFLHGFVARGLKHVGQSLDGTERITPELRSQDEVLEMIRSGEIEDGKTIALFLYWRSLLA